MCSFGSSSQKIFFLGQFIVYVNGYDRPRSVRFYKLRVSVSTLEMDMEVKRSFLV